MAEKITDAELVAQIAGARAREDAERRSGLRATRARFDARAGRVVLELSNGYGFAFPTRAIRSLRRAAIGDLSQVSLDPSGAVLQWKSLDVDLSVPGLLLAAIGTTERRRHLARLAGQSKSDAKAEAARRNGLKGGRPAIRKGGRRAPSVKKTRSGSTRTK